MKVKFVTLGCKVNQTESQGLAQMLKSAGHEIGEESPDAVIINTCTVTETSSGKSRRMIRRMVREHPHSRVIVMGCYAQIRGEEIRTLEGVDLILGTQERSAVLAYLERWAEERWEQDVSSCAYQVRAFAEQPDYEELPLLREENKTRAMLKVQDGCSQFCTYCIVPYARGPSRSRDPERVLAEGRSLLAQGYRELVLTGIHIGAYGRDISEGWDLSRLASRLAELPGLDRLRLGSLEPLELTDSFLRTVEAHPKICSHFHIPLQSGCDTVLARMGRPYTTGMYRKLLEKLRRIRPEAAIAADVLTGFPGETEQEHRDTCQLLRECAFAGLHVFPYSPRQGTPAAEMPGQVPKKVKEARVREIIEIGAAGRRDYIRQFEGRAMTVLLEQVEEDGRGRGHTDNYLHVELPASLNPGAWRSGQLVSCVLHAEYIQGGHSDE